MLFGGTSVTAGHDNYFNQTYPAILLNKLYPIFDALGIELSVRNIAQGQNGCLPYDLCYNGMGGFGDEPLDYIGWEQSFNCGRNGNYFEIMARIAGFQKAILFMTASGTMYYGKHCPEDEVYIHIGYELVVNNVLQSDDNPRHDANWTPNETSYPSMSISEKEMNAYRSMLTTWGKKANSIARFTGYINMYYKVPIQLYFLVIVRVLNEFH